MKQHANKLNLSRIKACPDKQSLVQREAYLEKMSTLTQKYIFYENGGNIICQTYRG